MNFNFVQYTPEYEPRGYKMPYAFVICNKNMENVQTRGLVFKHKVTILFGIIND